MCFIILFFKIVLFVLLYRDIKLVLLQQWAEIWRLDFFLVSMSNTRESSLLHLKLINSSFFLKRICPPWFISGCPPLHDSLCLVPLPQANFGPVVMCTAVCHPLTSLFLIAHRPDRSRSEVPLWTQQVIHSQDCCQHHRWAKSASPRWAVKLDIINPALSRINQERAAASENSLLPLQVKHETTVSRA